MLKSLSVALMLMLSGQNVLTGPSRKFSTTLPCTPPSVVSRWAPYNSSNTCSGGCSNGNRLDTLADFTGGNAENFQAGTPTYTTGVLSQPVVVLNGTPYYGPSSGSTQITGTFYVILNLDSACNGNSVSCVLMGGAGNGFMEWRANGNGSTAHQEILNQGIAVLATGSTIPNSWVALIATLDGSNNIAMYQCTSGTCSAAGTGTASGLAHNTALILGGATASLDGKLQGSVAEWGYLSTVSAGASGTNQVAIAAWSSCKFGV